MMEISVKMSANEFIEFMEWRKDRDAANSQVRATAKDMEKMAEKVFAALEACGKTDAPEFRIKSQDAAALLIEAAAEVFAQEGRRMNPIYKPKGAGEVYTHEPSGVDTGR